MKKIKLKPLILTIGAPSVLVKTDVNCLSYYLLKILYVIF